MILISFFSKTYSIWNQLEQVFYNNISQYTVYDAIDVSLWNNHIAIAGNSWQTSWNTYKGHRGLNFEDHHIGHAAAMKDICPPKSTGTQYTYMQGSKGYSKEHNEGGFNATMVGRIKAVENPVTTEDRLMKQNSRAYNADYWTNSQNSITNAWIRDFNVQHGWLLRTTFIKTHLLSVRCKKK